MLTIFATPKPFLGHAAIIQRNAILSWLQIYPQPEIILLGNSAGVAEVTKEFGLIHIVDVECNELGTPLVRSLFQIAQAIGVNQYFMYINSDIILLGNIINRVISEISFNKFLITGQRWNLDITEYINFADIGWEEKIRLSVESSGQKEGPQAMDYFLFSKNLYQDIPPFAIGRPSWDNWLLYETLRLDVPVIDGSAIILAVHQNHDYNHHPKGKTGVWHGEEAKISRQLAGTWNPAIFRLEGATYRLTPKGLEQPILTLNQKKNNFLMKIVLFLHHRKLPRIIESMIILLVNIIHQIPGALKKRLGKFWCSLMSW
jgi:hypothetical protein